VNGTWIYARDFPHPGGLIRRIEEYDKRRSTPFPLERYRVAKNTRATFWRQYRDSRVTRSFAPAAASSSASPTQIGPPLDDRLHQSVVVPHDTGSVQSHSQSKA